MMWKINTSEKIKLAVCSVLNTLVSDNKTGYDNLLIVAENYRDRYKDLSFAEIPGIQNARGLFRQIGIDPTRHRPSSESLLRRALRQLDYYRVNSLVDIGNWCSLDFLLPICVYDAEKISGLVELRLGREGEAYTGHTGKTVNLYNRYCVCDEQGPFGSPITDSTRTAVDQETTSAFLVIFAPVEYPDNLLQQQAELFAKRAIEVGGGQINELYFLQN